MPIRSPTRATFVLLSIMAFITSTWLRIFSDFAVRIAILMRSSAQAGDGVCWLTARATAEAIMAAPSIPISCVCVWRVRFLARLSKWSLHSRSNMPDLQVQPASPPHFHKTRRRGTAGPQLRGNCSGLYRPGGTPAVAPPRTLSTVRARSDSDTIAPPPRRRCFLIPRWTPPAQSSSPCHPCSAMSSPKRQEPATDPQRRFRTQVPRLRHQ